MTKGPLRTKDEASVEHWARKLFGKRYESLTDDEALQCQNALGEFLRQWSEEIRERLGGER